MRKLLMVLTLAFFAASMVGCGTQVSEVVPEADAADEGGAPTTFDEMYPPEVQASMPKEQLEMMRKEWERNNGVGSAPPESE